MHVGARAGTGAKWARTTLDWGVVWEDVSHPTGPGMRRGGLSEGIVLKGAGQGQGRDTPGEGQEVHDPQKEAGGDHWLGQDGPPGYAVLEGL